MRIDAGARVVPRFEGNEHYDGDALAASLGLETETDRSPAHLADKLRSFYEKRGFLDVEVRTEVRGAEIDAVQELVFHIAEQARARRREATIRAFQLTRSEPFDRRSRDPRTRSATRSIAFSTRSSPGADLFIDPDAAGLKASDWHGRGRNRRHAREPIVLSPDTTYVAETYDRAAEHMQELYRNEGFLHALVGPAQLVRAACDRRSPASQCTAIPPKHGKTIDVCTYDAAGLPLATDVVDRSLACRARLVAGEYRAPRLSKSCMPIKLGPRTQLWDIAFTGVHHVGEQDVAQAASLTLGEAVSTTQIEDSRRRIVAWYKEQGYAYVDVKYALEPSLDGTRARVRFDVVEGDRVIVERDRDSRARADT